MKTWTVAILEGGQWITWGAYERRTYTLADALSTAHWLRNYWVGSIARVVNAETGQAIVLPLITPLD